MVSKSLYKKQYFLEVLVILTDLRQFLGSSKQTVVCDVSFLFYQF